MKQKLAEWINVVYGFRKLLIMLALLFISITFRTKDLINGQEFVDLLTSTVIAFFTANGVEHITATVKGSMRNRTTSYKGLADTDESNDEKEIDLR